ncbi:MAG: transposase, partial [Cyanobacteria bacterium P01_E01_bin.42]
QMPRRIQAYAALAEEKYQLPVYPVLVNLLKPEGKRTIPTRYESEFAGMRALREYKVINLWEIEAQTILNTPIRPLIPFVPLLKDGNQELMVQEALRMLRADEQLQDFETLLSFFASFVLDANLVKQILRWDMAVLEASPLYRELLEQARKTVLQEGIEQGIEQGIKQGIEQERRKVVESVMKLRFDLIDPELEAIVPKLIAFPTEESLPLIMQRSRQELLEQFADRN